MNVDDKGTVVLKDSRTPSLYIPPEFVGMQCNLVAAPTGCIYGATRAWDNRAGTTVPGNIKSIAPSSGTYAWDGLDALFLNNPAKKIHITLGCPPDWMVTRAAVGGATAYGGKSNMVPDDLEAFCEAVKQIILRGNAVGRSGFVWCLWNEINGTGFFNDSLALLGPYTKQVAATIRQYDPTGTILAPNTNIDPELLATVLEISDGGGGKIKDYVDGVSMHTYHLSGTLGNAVRIFYDAVNNFKQVLSDTGMGDAEIHMNEAGVNSTYFYAANLHSVRMLLMAAMGVKSYMGYTWDHQTYAISSYVSNWNATAQLISGKNIDYAALEQGSKFVIIVDGVRQEITL